MSLSRRNILAAGVALPAAALVPADPAGATSVEARGAAPSGSPIRPAPVIPIEAGDTPERIVAKAAHVVPTPHQLAWQRNEIAVFTHFGMNTFTDREWGSGAEDPAWFDPERVDVEQWMRAYRATGAKLVMLTAKHHEGFVLYPTRYTPHSVIASPWWVRGASTGAVASARARAARTPEPSAYWQVRDAGATNPDGDILGRYVKAARDAGLKVGVYLSPADGAELPHAWHAGYVEKVRAKHAAGEPLSIQEQATLDDAGRTPSGLGRYGNGSRVRARTIPTPVDNDDRADALARGELPTFQVECDDYNAFYLDQVYELFTEYGPIDELWLDGANPWADSGVTQEYDFALYYKIFSELSPHTVMFQAPRGIRWIGNEDGIARETEWSVVPIVGDEVRMPLPGGAQAPDLGSRDRLTDPAARSLHWYPGEADVSNRDGWFHHPDERSLSAAELVELYEASVGRNAALLLNVPPAKNGRVDADDARQLAAFGASVKDTYATDLLAGGRGRDARILTDGDPATAWSPRAGATTGAVEVQLPRPGTFDRIRLGEDIGRGQRIEEFAVDISTGSAWQTVATGTTIGYSRILTLPASVTTTRVRVRIERARATPRLASLGLHLQAPPD